MNELMEILGEEWRKKPNKGIGDYNDLISWDCKYVIFENAYTNNNHEFPWHVYFSPEGFDYEIMSDKFLKGCSSVEECMELVRQHRLEQRV